MFLISTFVPSGFPFSCNETLTSQRILPSSILTSLIPKYNKVSLNFSTYKTASSALSISGRLTISIRGTPALLKFNKVACSV